MSEHHVKLVRGGSGFWVETDTGLVFQDANTILVGFENGLYRDSTLLRLVPGAPAKPLKRYLRELVLTASSDFQSAVEAEEGLFRAAFARAPIGMVYSDLAGIILHCNHNFAEMLGYEPHELAGMRVGEVSSTDSRDLEVAYGNRLLSGEIASFEIDKGFIARDGSTVLTKTAVALIRDANGIPTAAVAHILDVRGTRELEERLEVQRKARESSEARFERMFQNAPQAMLMVGGDGRVRQANRRAALFLGREEEAIVGRLLTDVGDADGMVTERIRALAETPDADQNALDAIWTSASGRQHNVSVGFVKLLVDDVECILTGITDVTAELEATTALQSSLAEKEILLREIHHRVKNNLALVQSLLQLQAMRLDSPSARSALDESARRVATMAAIHESLYGMGSVSHVNLRRYVDDLVRSLQAAYAPEANAVVEAPNSEVPLKLAVPIGLILNELITNAFKYGLANQHDVDGPDVYVGLCVADSTLHLVVADRGRDCSPDVLDPATTSFGMRMVRALLRQLRAQIGVNFDEGTRFTIECEVIDLVP